MRTARAFAAAVALVLVAAAPPELGYRLSEGQNLNLFARGGPVAAHVLLRSGTDPRILVAFPAGNSGVGLWFERLAAAATWRVERGPDLVTLPDAHGRPLHGVRLTVSTDATRLVPLKAVLSSVRFLRDYQAIGKTPSEISVPLVFSGTGARPAP